jgi:hypothetical protein
LGAKEADWLLALSENPHNVLRRSFIMVGGCRLPMIDFLQGSIGKKHRRGCR